MIINGFNIFEMILKSNRVLRIGTNLKILDIEHVFNFFFSWFLASFSNKYYSCKSSNWHSFDLKNTYKIRVFKKITTLIKFVIKDQIWLKTVGRIQMWTNNCVYFKIILKEIADETERIDVVGSNQRWR